MLGGISRRAAKRFGSLNISALDEFIVIDGEHCCLNRRSLALTFIGRRGLDRRDRMRSRVAFAKRAHADASHDPPETLD